MTLKDHIAARIRLDGPLSVADYMTDCLLHPEFGYYTTGDPFGQQGDFVTAPEISQMFGELIGLSIAQSWLNQGSPSPFALAELGPGRGTLIADALRAAGRVPGFLDATQLWLVEASPVLRDTQRQTLGPYAPNWATAMAGLPDMPLFLIANEFFDALPIRQFQRTDRGWRERRVGLDETGALTFGLAGESHPRDLVHRLEDTKTGDLVEIAPMGAAIAQDIAGRIAARGGIALIVDYGDWRSLGDTLQALKDHQPVSPLADPGASDLTAHVDFEPLAEAAITAGARHTRVTPQGVFLERLGITERARALAAATGGKAANDIADTHRRLTHPDEMGNLFKVIGFYPTSAAPPPGLEP